MVLVGYHTSIITVNYRVLVSLGQTLRKCSLLFLLVINCQGNNNVGKAVPVEDASFNVLLTLLTPTFSLLLSLSPPPILQVQRFMCTPGSSARSDGGE